MKTVKDIELRKGFWLEREAINRLAGTLQRRGLAGSIHIRCSDRSRIKIESLGELYDFPNSSSRQITGLEITGHGKKLNFNLAFSADYPRDTLVRGTLLGDDRDVVAFSRDLEEFLESVRPSYSKYFLFEPITETVLGWLIFAVVVTGLMNSDTAGLQLSKFVTTSEAYAQPLSRLILGATTLMILVAWNYDNIRKLMFPVAVFAFGAGARRAAGLRHVRAFVFGTLGCGLTLGIAGNFISSRLGF